MIEIQRKKQMIGVEIRKQQRQKIFSSIRDPLLLQKKVTEQMTKFIQEMHPFIPSICVQNYHLINGQPLNTFLYLMMNNELRFSEYENEKINTWYFDCRQINNLKFAANMCNREKADHRFGHFFHSTVQVHEPEFQLYLHLVNRYGASKCQIKSEEDQSPEAQAIRNLSNKQCLKDVRALFYFWGSYIGNTMDTILNSNFQRVLKIFNLFAEYTEILLYQQAYFFMNKIINYILKMKVFEQKYPQQFSFLNLRNDHSDYWEFIQNIKKRIPYMFKMQVHNILNYPQLGHILISFFKLEEYRSGIFIQSIFSSEHYIKLYIINLFRDSSSDSLNCIKTGLKVVHKIYQYGNANKILQLDGIISINNIIAHQLLYNSKVKLVSVIVLYNVLEQDINDRHLTKVFESVYYEQVLSDVDESDLPDVFQFLVKIMQTYQNNFFIYDKLLLDCELEKVMREFYRGRQDQRGYAEFSKLVGRNIQFFIEHYRQTIRDMEVGLSEMFFDGLEGVILRIQEEVGMSDVIL